MIESLRTTRVTFLSTTEISSEQKRLLESLPGPIWGL